MLCCYVWIQIIHPWEKYPLHNGPSNFKIGLKSSEQKLVSLFRYWLIPLLIKKLIWKVEYFAIRQNSVQSEREREFPYRSLSSPNTKYYFIWSRKILTALGRTFWSSMSRSQSLAMHSISLWPSRIWKILNMLQTIAWKYYYCFDQIKENTRVCWNNREIQRKLRTVLFPLFPADSSFSLHSSPLLCV